MARGITMRSDFPEGMKARRRNMPKKHRKHTPIVSKKQRGLFGAELARRREGKKRRMPDITTKELESHLEESRGKRLVRKRRKRK